MLLSFTGKCPNRFRGLCWDKAICRWDWWTYLFNLSIKCTHYKLYCTIKALWQDLMVQNYDLLLKVVAIQTNNFSLFSQSKGEWGSLVSLCPLLSELYEKNGRAYRQEWKTGIFTHFSGQLYLIFLEACLVVLLIKKNVYHLKLSWWCHKCRHTVLTIA